MSKLVSLRAIQTRLNEERPLSHFLRSPAYRRAYEYLTTEQHHKHADIIRRTRPTHHTPSDARVHPLVAMEYLRWVDYSHYARRICSLGEVSERTNRPDS